MKTRSESDITWHFVITDVFMFTLEPGGFMQDANSNLFKTTAE